MATAATLTAAVDAAVSAADAAGAGDAADAVARLQELEEMNVTTALLMATSAGKRVRKLVKLDNQPIAAAAAAVVAAWKATVSASAGGDAGAKRAAPSPPPGDGGAKKAKPDGEQKAAPPGPSPATPAAAATATAARGAPTTGDPARDKAVASLASALALVPDADRDGADPTSVAAAVERAALAAAGGGAVSAAYKAKLRSLLFNLRAPDNPDLRRDVMAGEWDPADLVVAPPEALASRARRAQNAAIREAALFEAERGQNLKKATTDQFQCGKCRQRKCTYFQMQTRSADEPMTTFVTCVACGNRWKFC